MERVVVHSLRKAADILRFKLNISMLYVILALESLAVATVKSHRTHFEFSEKKCNLYDGCVREHPDMMSVLEGEGLHGKADVVREVV